MTVHLHKNDLPDGINFGASVAVDTETQGLSLVRDKLCLVQLSAGDGDAHIVQMDRNSYNAPNLKKLMTDPAVTKIFHFARFDVAMMMRDLGVTVAPVFCYTDRHGLKDLTKELINVDLSKQQQSSDWAADELTEAQLNYAASDVLYLHQLKTILSARLGWSDVDIFSHRMRRAD